MNTLVTFAIIFGCAMLAGIFVAVSSIAGSC